MPRPQNPLPLELWIPIASNLSNTNDLAHLCITSSRFFHIVRPFLYRNVKIKAVGSQSNASNVLELLARDKALAKCVIRLTLERHSPSTDHYTRPSLIDPDALANMVSLQHVVLYGLVFTHVHEQLDFGRALANISLDELAYAAHNAEEWFPIDLMGDIGGLKKLYWNGR